MSSTATEYIDLVTTLQLGQTRIHVPEPAPESVLLALQNAIVSGSGWRFIAAPAGEEDSAEELSTESTGLAWLMATAVADFYTSKHSQPPTILVACDSRPTGAAIASIFIRALLAREVRVRYSFIAASPEVMAYAAQEPDLDGFIYITASHNPVGYNGIKMGGSGGGVFAATEARQAAERLYTIASDKALMSRHYERFNQVSDKAVASILENTDVWKKALLRAYTRWTDLISFNEEAILKSTLTAALEHEPVGILHDMNGSARCNSIDNEYLKEIGCHVEAINPGLRNFSHAIVPEGESLLPCCRALNEIHAKHPEYVLGFVPDNDGDRGNLVIYDGAAGYARPFGGQEVFALSTIAELSWLVYSGQISYDDRNKLKERVAVVVNGPTSLRIDAICRMFDVEVYRAEVGEANVIELAEILRAKGYIVRLLGEGSNGGTILHPARIRDPLNTVISLLKFLRLPPNERNLRPWQIWAQRCSNELESVATTDMTAILKSAQDDIPVFQTTGAYETRAVLSGTVKNHGLLKAQYEQLFLDFWERERSELNRRFGFFTYKIFNTEGPQLRAGMGKEYRTGDESGGFSVLFKDNTGLGRGFFWMRGSKTEPVFRVMVDIQSEDPADEQYLFAHHLQLVHKANEQAQSLVNNNQGE